MENKKQKNNSKTIFLFIAILVFLLFILVSFLIQYRENKELKNSVSVDNSQTEEVNTGKFSASFPTCGLIYNDCLDTTCGLYFLCNEKKYLTCEIYDCGEEFGVGTEDESGETRIVRELKIDKDKVEELVSKCRGGSLNIIDKECVGNKLIVNVNLDLNDKCEIKNFMAEYNLEGEKTFSSVDEFSDLGDDNYLLTMNNCDDLVEFIAIGEGGVGIR
ncbi:MAG: hypothetical protein KAS01_00270 [Candidatus Pacebacteria bacterium]|nr:hypothetical protein [Candidatus Paceibacterota bacterium]